MLTTIQALVIASQKTEPPWSLRQLINEYQLRKITRVRVGTIDASVLMEEYLSREKSLRSFIRGVANQKTVIWVKVADPSQINPLSFSDLQSLQRAIDNAPTPSRALLDSLSQVVKPMGVSLVISKNTWRVIGLFGSNDSLNRVPALHINDMSAAAPYFATGTGAFGGALVAISMVPEPASPILFGIGYFFIGMGAGFSLGKGVLELKKPPEPQKSPTSSSLGDFPDDSIGSPPEDIKDMMATGDGGDYGDFIINDPIHDLPLYGPEDPTGGEDVSGDGVPEFLV